MLVGRSGERSPNPPRRLTLFVCAVRRRGRPVPLWGSLKQSLSDHCVILRTFVARGRRALACQALCALVAVFAPGAARAATTVTLDAPPAPVLAAGPRECGNIALTFDLCPASHKPGFDAPLVRWLIEHQVPATFFASGRWIARHPEPLAELAAVPFFELGTHGARHLHLPALGEDAQRAEIGGAIDALASRTGRRPTLFRPPYGEYDRTTLGVAESLGQRVVMWDVVSGDPSPELSAGHMWATVASQAEPGSIVIFHANGNGHHTLEVVEHVVTELAPRRGWKLVTVSELAAGCDGASATPAAPPVRAAP